ncbi:MAG: diphthamide biosynthesis enzyme Dph2 [Methanoregulaceae archaeon]
MLSNGSSDLIARLNARGAKTVALQFPEGLKRRSVRIATDLKEAGFDVIISGDPCYGACDLALDTIPPADVLVHFGHAPVDERENVLYEQVPMDFDVAALDAARPLIRGRKVGIVTTVQHAHLVSSVVDHLRNSGIDAVVSKGSGRTPYPGQVLGCNFSAARISGADTILYIGTGLFHALGVALATHTKVIALDPYTGLVQEANPEPLLRKRFTLIEKARRAGSIGILVSTKTGQNRLDLARRLASLSYRAFLVTMREISPGELLNLGFGCYVNTACPRLAYDDQARFPVPVLSPPEFEIAMGRRSWDDYIVDEIV